MFIEVGPDITPPEATTALTPILVGYRTGWFRVVAACADNRAVVTTDALLNGFAVDDGDLALLITMKRGNRHVPTRLFDIFKAPRFELAVTCTDEAGNVSTATAIAEFPAPPGNRPR